MFSPSASARATAAAVTEQRLQQLIRERAGGGIAGIPQDMQEVQAAGSVVTGRVSPSAQLMSLRWTPDTPLSHASSPAGLGVQAGHGGEEHLPQLTVSAYGGVRGDGGGASVYGLSPSVGVPTTTPVPAGPQASGTKKSVRLLVPAEKYPDFNFVGRILGPRGATLKALERETSCKIMIRGRGSIRRDKEAEVRGKPGWAHCFSDPLHVIIEADATDEAAATRALNRAKEAVELLLVPVPEEQDGLKRQQLRDLAIINGACRAADAVAAAAAAAAAGKTGEAAAGSGSAMAHLPDESRTIAAPPAWTPPTPVTPVFGGRYSSGTSGSRSMAPRSVFPSDLPIPGMLGGQTAFGGAASGLIGGPYGGRQPTSVVAATPPLMAPQPLVSPLSSTPSGNGDGGTGWSFAESVSNISLDGGLADPTSGSGGGGSAGGGGGGGVGGGGGGGGASGGGTVAFGGEATDKRHLDLKFEVRPDAERPCPDTPVTAPSIKTLVAPTSSTPVATGVGSGGFMSQDFYGGAFSDYGRSVEARGWSSPSTERLSAPTPPGEDISGRPAA
ncbi:hypothetical protein MMPV_006878 [Pyropia vietnamensis]